MSPFPRRVAWPAPWVLLASIAACGDKALQQQQIAENARKVTAESTNDATAAIVDEGYRFRLEWPGDGWKLLGPQDAARVVPDAVAGAMKEAMNFAVIVEPIAGATVDQMVDLVMSAPSLTEVEVESRTSVDFLEQDARRVVFTAVVEGISARFANTVFVRAGHCYQLVSWGPRDRFTVADIDPVLRGFSLTPGEIVGRAAKASVDRDGPGWRVQKGVFESAASGLRVVPAPGWELRTGDELMTMNEDAEVGLESPGLGAYIAILPEKVAKGDAAGFVTGFRSRAAVNLGTESTGEWKAEVLGRSTTFAMFPAPPLELLSGAHAVGEDGYQVVAWYPATTGETVRPSLVGALAGITVLDPAARLALRDRLLAAPDTTSHVGSSHALRGGVFREFAVGLLWRKPAGFWRLSGGDQPSTPEIVESLAFENLDAGISGHLAIEERVDGNALAWHEERVAKRGGRAGRRTELRLAGRKAHATEVIFDAGGLEISSTVATLMHGVYGIEIVVAGHAARMAGARADVQAVFAALELVDELPEIHVVEGEYRDERFGYGVRPPSGWPATEETPAAVAAVMTIRLWKHDRSELRVFAFDAGSASADSQFAADRMEQSVREKLTITLGPAQAGMAKLGTLDADHTTWTKWREHAEWFVAKRDDRVFAMLATDLDADVLDEVVRSFHTLE